MATEERRTSDPAQLFSGYVALCNRAMTENRDTFWFRQAMHLNKALWQGRRFRALVYDQDPGAVVAAFTVQMDMDKPEIRLLQDDDAQAVSFTWKTPLSYLEEVVSQPQRYIEHPMLLDWEWLKERMQDEARYRADGKSVVTGFVLGAATAVIAGKVLSRRRNTRSLHQ